MADIEFDIGVAIARNKTGTAMWCWSPADLDLTPWDTTCSMNKEIFEQIGCQ